MTLCSVGHSARTEEHLENKLAAPSGPSTRAAEAGLVLDPPVIRSKNPSICYLGFRSTSAGREYALRVSDGATPRVFLLLITHQAFADHEARYQDGPDLCFSKLSHDIDADPELQPAHCVELSVRELREYSSRDRPSPGPKRRQPRR